MVINQSAHLLVNRSWHINWYTQPGPAGVIPSDFITEKKIKIPVCLVVVFWWQTDNCILNNWDALVNSCVSSEGCNISVQPNSNTSFSLDRQKKKPFVEPERRRPNSHPARWNSTLNALSSSQPLIFWRQRMTDALQNRDVCLLWWDSKHTYVWY